MITLEMAKQEIGDHERRRAFFNDCAEQCNKRKAACCPAEVLGQVYYTKVNCNVPCTCDKVTGAILQSFWESTSAESQKCCIDCQYLHACSFHDVIKSELDDACEIFKEVE